MIKPVLSIIIVSYNTAAITLDCLRSVLADKGLQFDLDRSDSSAKIPTELIIIDNASKDNSPQVIQKFFTDHRSQITNSQLLVNPKNVGFAQANNQGFKLAQGNYILLLNSDTLILHSAISQSLDWLASHPEASACTAQLLNSDRTVQPTGGYFPNLFNVFTWCTSLDDLPLVNHFIPPFHPHPPQFYTHDRFYLSDRQLDWITGAYLLIRRPTLEAVNGFDPSYFMYGEEMEMCYRIKKLFPQTQFWYLIGPQIVHLGGASSPQKVDPLQNEYQGIMAFFVKHRPLFQQSLVRHLLKINRRLRYYLYTLLGRPAQANLYAQIHL
jgi:GT2 family glycosyltransferase